MSFMVSHIYRNDNYCIDKLANICHHMQNLVWLNIVYNEITDDFTMNKFGSP
jgi:hypothetical protein